MGILAAFTTLLATTTVLANPSRQMDIAFDRTAYGLELVRNQIELTVRNHSASPRDIRRQEMDFNGMGVFTKIPLARDDASITGIAAIREDFGLALSGKPGPRLESARFTGPWKVAPRKVPRAIPFDRSYRLPDDQIVDHRGVELRFTVDANAPSAKDLAAWLRSLSREGRVRRLVEPLGESACSVKPRGSKARATCRARVYRYRDVRYPEFLAPDLSRYALPGAPRTESQRQSARRIEKYRADIVRLWPEAEPRLAGLREFALNDARIGFFIQHMK